jgi:hypothetical protein
VGFIAVERNIPDAAGFIHSLSGHKWAGMSQSGNISFKALFQTI